LSSGPLSGLRVVELSGLGPAPFCGMVLADFGAEVVRVDRVDPAGILFGESGDVTGRGKESICVDIRSEPGAGIVLQLVEQSDALIEGFRPGVAERLGLGPDVCLERNPRLVYGRMTGWGQEGPLAGDAGHDINYIALAGVLGSIGTEESPVVPLNLIGDYGGGGMLLALGMVAALFQARETGSGQVVDAAMVDGASLLMAPLHGLLTAGMWQSRRAANLLDGSAPFYTTYPTADGGHVAVGALEPQFFAALLDLLDLDQAGLPAQYDPEGWPMLRTTFGGRFLTKTRDQWAALAAGTDACVAPVLDIVEATNHPHNMARGTFLDIDGTLQPGPAPRFSKTPAVAGDLPVRGGQTDRLLGSLGYTSAEIGMLRESRIVA
jgi:alpha-methylacyl-CoA racemase